MASGSDAARGTAHIVLLDSNFTSLPGVVFEGRQVINNIERVACLYLTKTIFSVLLSIYFIVTGLSYPFFPIHLTLIGAVTIGIPSFFLALEPNGKRVEPGFLKKIMLNAVPGGVAVALYIILLSVFQKALNVDAEQLRTIAVLITAAIGFQVLIRASRPLNLIRIALLLAMAALFIAALLITPAAILLLPIPTLYSLIVFGIFAATTIPVIFLIRKLIEYSKFH